MSKFSEAANNDVSSRKKDEELSAMDKKVDSTKASTIPGKEPSTSQVTAVFNDILESLIVDIAAEAHRAARLGLDFRLQAEEMEEASLRLSEASKLPGTSAELNGSKYTIDVFGQTHPAVAMESFACKNCGRTVVAGRYAPHLEKCMNNKGRNASRVASRNIQNSARQQQRASPMLQAAPPCADLSLPATTTGDFWGKVPTGNKRSRSRTPSRTPIISPEEGSARSGGGAEAAEDGTSEESRDQEDKEDATYGPGSAKSKKGRSSGSNQKQKQRSVGLSGLGAVNRSRSHQNGLPPPPPAAAGAGLPPVAPTAPTSSSGGRGTAGAGAQGKSRHSGGGTGISPTPLRVQQPPYAATSPVGSSAGAESAAAVTGKRKKGAAHSSWVPSVAARQGGGGGGADDDDDDDDDEARGASTGAQCAWPSSSSGVLRSSKVPSKSEGGLGGGGSIAGDPAVTLLKQKLGPAVVGAGSLSGAFKGDEMKKTLPSPRGQGRPGPEGGGGPDFTGVGGQGDGDEKSSVFEFENSQTKRKNSGVRLGKGKVGKQSAL